jgi:hypothetical protein
VAYLEIGHHFPDGHLFYSLSPVYSQSSFLYILVHPAHPATEQTGAVVPKFLIYRRSTTNNAKKFFPLRGGDRRNAPKYATGFYSILTVQFNQASHSKFQNSRTQKIQNSRTFSTKIQSQKCTDEE